MSVLHDLQPADDAGDAGAPRPGRRLHAVADPAPLDFDDAVRRLTPRLQRYATRRLGDRHEAEELVQEALLRAYGHRASLATEDDLAAWTTCVTGRLVIDRLRVRGRSINVADVPENGRAGRDTADVVVGREQARLALDALDAMPARQASVLWSREVEGLSYDDIAERFAMTEPAVRSTLSRARKALRREFATRGGSLPAVGLVALAPWIDGLGWAEKLRRSATRIAAPAVLGVAGLGVLSGLLPMPWSVPGQGDGPARTLQVSESVVGATQAAARAVPSGTNPTTAARVRPAGSATSAQAAAGRPAVLARTGLNDTCVARDQVVGAGGRGCAPPPSSAVTLLRLPENPSGVREVGLSNDVVDCDAVPLEGGVPLVTCSASASSSPSSSRPPTSQPSTSQPSTSQPSTSGALR